MYFHDTNIAKEILSTNDVAKIKTLGRQVSNYNDVQWNGIRQIVVYEGLYAKFSQNTLLKQKLITTKNATLAECAVNDKIWGIGLSMHDQNHFNLSKWKGPNLLDFTLMMVRDKL